MKPHSGGYVLHAYSPIVGRRALRNDAETIPMPPTKHSSKTSARKLGVKPKPANAKKLPAKKATRRRVVSKESSDRRATTAAGPEMYFALVGAIGTDLDFVTSALKVSLSEVNYQARVVRLSGLLAAMERDKPLRTSPLLDRYIDLMDAGDQFRKDAGRSDAMALLSILNVRDLRNEITGTKLGNIPARRTAFIFHSLKTPEEIDTLRATYGGGLFVIAAYSPEQERLDRLRQRSADENERKPDRTDENAATELIRRDERDSAQQFGQNVSGAFPKADLFVNVSDEASARKAIDRFVHLLFGYEFYTPTRDENGMFHAQAASLRSAEMGRQVGAAITTHDGSLVAVGTNDLPRAGGGLHWQEDGEDPRDWKKGFDTSDQMKRQNLLEVLQILQDRKLLKRNLWQAEPDELLEVSTPHMKGTRLMNAIEFGRAVHAEMSAITDAASRGVQVRGGTLFTTTFPCHNCAKHIISAGILRVVYIEPYAKSLASKFHDDSLVLDVPQANRAATHLPDSATTRVRCEPFVGIAPRLYMQLFLMTKRKEMGGASVSWDGKAQAPRYGLLPQHVSYLQLEELRARDLQLALGDD